MIIEKSKVAKKLDMEGLHFWQWLLVRSKDVPSQTRLRENGYAIAPASMLRHYSAFLGGIEALFCPALMRVFYHSYVPVLCANRLAKEISTALRMSLSEV